MRRILLVLTALSLLASSAFAFTFRDDAGDSYTFDKAPEKVVVLNSSNLELFIAAGGKPAAYGESGTMPAYLGDHIKSIPSVGKVQSPDIERIVAMKPDLVIGMNFPFHISLKSSLKQAGIPLAVFGVHDRKDLAAKMEIFGQITGKPDMAFRKVASINTDIEKAVKTVGKPSKKILVVYGTPESFNMALPSSFIGEIAEFAGGINIAGEDMKGGTGMYSGFVPVSLEYVTMADPDMIFIISHGNKAAPAADGQLMKQPAWSALRAVKSGKVISLPFDTYGINPTVRLGEAVLELSSLIYPEKYK
ncbi:ABC transporter substrate-binding protein [Geovibrio thiophilus]|uniref:ABC transporter substrate-binding protein n=1 Tax=Geovibrio thiophilus TaxID=139438 RepID=A0A3R5X354_9BACT|nr:ABC transporter substrate-binding protein [Geovibrio thiophilus]QAR33423.1 ABC transporter substrate-binding protein [Geovibrio thiophilus]